MTKLNLNQLQSYFDSETKEELNLCFNKYETIIDGIKVILENVPLLINSKNQKIFFPDKTKYFINHFINEAKKRKEKGISLKTKEIKEIRYPFAEKFDFKYSYVDYEYIPGLYRDWNEGFLTPVFFNMKVLNKYSQDPEYKLEIFSGTYGSIYKGEDWHIAFGINKNHRVIMWLGDIDELPEEEKYYLRSENVESDHDIHSEFYNGQIEVQFSEPSIETKTFQLKNELQSKVLKKFEFEIYSFHGEISEILENLNLPIYWNEKQVYPFIASLNSVFNESINISELKKYIETIDKNIDLKGKGSLKVFEKWLELKINSEKVKELMLPFYVLYDFRIISSHLVKKEKKENTLQSICNRLDLEYEKDIYNEIYQKIISKLHDSFLEIIKLYFNT